MIKWTDWYDGASRGNGLRELFNSGANTALEYGPTLHNIALRNYGEVEGYRTLLVRHNDSFLTVVWTPQDANSDVWGYGIGLTQFIPTPEEVAARIRWLNELAWDEVQERALEA